MRVAGELCVDFGLTIAVLAVGLADRRGRVIAELELAGLWVAVRQRRASRDGHG
ncbi:MAG TPA: hypothetical protein VKP89_11230 [Burkholderiales bacterium]|nr:hypothetical protein [Burkholderiales bacterium]